MPSSSSNPSPAAGLGSSKKVAEEDEELKVGDSEAASSGVKTTPLGDIPDAIVFICETYTDFLSWRKALESYVV